MNKAILIGRLTKDPEVRYTQGENPMAIAKFTLAVDDRSKKEEPKADFISCTGFGKTGEFIDKYITKGMKVALEGRISTGSYTHKETGIKIYTTDVIIEKIEFCESKGSAEATKPAAEPDNNDFMNIPDGLEAELPFV